MSNLRKRFLALTLAMLMLVGSLAITAMAHSFIDIDDIKDMGENKLNEAVSLLNALGIVRGTTETQFSPKDPVTRQQMAMFIGRTKTGTPDFFKIDNANPPSLEDFELTFTDLRDPGFYSAIRYAVDNGIVTGRSETTFDPTGTVSFQEAVTMIVRALGYRELSYPLGYLAKAQEIGLLDGFRINTTSLRQTSVTAPLTRGHVAALLYNYFFSDEYELRVTYNQITNRQEPREVLTPVANRFGITKVEGYVTAIEGFNANIVVDLQQDYNFRLDNNRWLFSERYWEVIANPISNRDTIVNNVNRKDITISWVESRTRVLASGITQVYPQPIHWHGMASELGLASGTDLTKDGTLTFRKGRELLGLKVSAYVTARADVRREALPPAVVLGQKFDVSDSTYVGSTDTGVLTLKENGVTAANSKVTGIEFDRRNTYASSDIWESTNVYAFGNSTTMQTIRPFSATEDDYRKRDSSTSATGVTSSTLANWSNGRANTIQLILQTIRWSYANNTKGFTLEYIDNSVAQDGSEYYFVWTPYYLEYRDSNDDGKIRMRNTNNDRTSQIGVDGELPSRFTAVSPFTYEVVGSSHANNFTNGFAYLYTRQGDYLLIQSRLTNGPTDVRLNTIVTNQSLSSTPDIAGVTRRNDGTNNGEETVNRLIFGNTGSGAGAGEGVFGNAGMGTSSLYFTFHEGLIAQSATYSTASRGDSNSELAFLDGADQSRLNSGTRLRYTARALQFDDRVGGTYDLFVLDGRALYARFRNPAATADDTRRYAIVTNDSSQIFVSAAGQQHTSIPVYEANFGARTIMVAASGQSFKTGDQIYYTLWDNTQNQNYVNGNVVKLLDTQQLANSVGMGASYLDYTNTNGFRLTGKPNTTTTFLEGIFGGNDSSNKFSYNTTNRQITIPAGGGPGSINYYVTSATRIIVTGLTFNVSTQSINSTITPTGVLPFNDIYKPTTLTLPVSSLTLQQFDNLINEAKYRTNASDSNSIINMVVSATGNQSNAYSNLATAIFVTVNADIQPNTANAGMSYRQLFAPYLNMSIQRRFATITGTWTQQYRPDNTPWSPQYFVYPSYDFTHGTVSSVLSVQSNLVNGTVVEVDATGTAPFSVIDFSNVPDATTGDSVIMNAMINNTASVKAFAESTEVGVNTPLVPASNFTIPTPNTGKGRGRVIEYNPSMNAIKIADGINSNEYTWYNLSSVNNTTRNFRFLEVDYTQLTGVVSIVTDNIGDRGRSHSDFGNNTNGWMVSTATTRWAAVLTIDNPDPDKSATTNTNVYAVTIVKFNIK